MPDSKEFVKKLSEKGYTKADTTVIIKDFLTSMEELFAEGKSIQFKGFGKFVVKDFNERECLSPKDKSRITVPAYRSVRFKISDALRQRIQEAHKKGIADAETK